MLVLLLYNFMLNYHEGGIIGTKHLENKHLKNIYASRSEF